MSSSKLIIWLQATRPKTLGAAIAPVLIGSSMAYDKITFSESLALMTLLGAILIQIGTNFANDYFDYIKGADNENRLGPTRATQAGLVSPSEMRFAFILTFSLAAIVGVYLTWKGGWILLLIGIVSIGAGISYTGGWAFGYKGLGDIFVLVFFGPIAVMGTYYLQTQTSSLAVFIASLAPGLIATAILVVNNLRDIETDKVAGKRTLVVKFGRSFARYEYLSCIMIACLIPWILYSLNEPLYIILSSLTLVVAIPTIKIIFTSVEGEVLNKALAQTGKLLLLYSVFFSIGYFVG